MATAAHVFISAISDNAADAAGGKVLPSHWNAAHTVTLGAETVTKLTTTQGAIVAAAPLYDATVTWNNVAVTFTGMKLNVTNTASAAASLLADWQVGGVSKFQVGVDGTLSWAGTSSALQSLQPFDDGGPGFIYVTSSTGRFGWDAGYVTLSFANTCGIGFCTTSVQSGPDVALKRNAVGVVEVNNGTLGTFRDLTLRNVNTNPTTVASLSGTTKGARSFVTDANATMTAGIGAVVVGGGANNVPVYYDGANWRIG